MSEFEGYELLKDPSLRAWDIQQMRRDIHFLQARSMLLEKQYGERFTTHAKIMCLNGFALCLHIVISAWLK